MGRAALGKRRQGNCGEDQGECGPVFHGTILRPIRFFGAPLRLARGSTRQFCPQLGLRILYIPFPLRGLAVHGFPSSGLRVGHIVSATIFAPFSVGWMPSGWRVPGTLTRFL